MKWFENGSQDCLNITENDSRKVKEEFNSYVALSQNMGEEKS